MPVVDVTFTKLEANKKMLEKAPVEGIKVNNNSKIGKVGKRKIPGMGEALTIEFEFTSKYTPDVGSINIGGTILFHEKNLKNHIREKKGSIELKGPAYETIQNTVLGASTVQALILAKELRLPSPVQLPTVSVKEEKLTTKKGYA